MVKTAIKVLLADAVLVGGLYLVLLDLQWKVSFATSNSMWNPGISYSVLTQQFAMYDPRLKFTLASPLSLSWLQLLILMMVSLNAWYVVRTITDRGHQAPSEENEVERPQPVASASQP